MKRWVIAVALVVCSIAPALSSEKILYLSRHGETHANHLRVLVGQSLQVNSTLTGRGQAQARSLALLVGHEGIKQIYTSRLSRTQQTAVPLAEALHLSPLVRSQLDEVDLGTLEGRSMDDPEVKRQLDRLNTEPLFRPGGGENQRDIQTRVSTLLDEILQRPGPEKILIVAHYGTVKAMLVLLLKLSLEESVKIVPPNDTVYRLTVREGLITEVALSEGRRPFSTQVPALFRVPSAANEKTEARSHP